jgi:hypothetical protein
MPTLVVVLKGGLGNQLFQYAAARALADRAGADLAIDAWTGFAQDYHYRRKPALAAFPVRGRPATLGERLPYWLFEFRRRIPGASIGPVHRGPGGTFLIEPGMRFSQEIHDARWKGTAWMDGYWQTDRWFAGGVRPWTELEPPEPARREAVELGARMAAEDSVAIGIRLYEESKVPAAHARTGRMRSAAEIRNAIARVLADHPGRKPYVFCTHRAPLLGELGLPAHAEFLVPEAGFTDAAETLWLMGRCRHIVFTNSSLYWWAAWLGDRLHAGRDRRVLAADDFLDPDSIRAGWERW